MDTTYAATMLVFLVFVASVVSVELALSAAIVEILLGVVAANVLHLEPAPWLEFVAGFGGILLTFLAGIEVDRQLLREKLKPSLLIGGCSFLIPFAPAVAYCHHIAQWDWHASLIAGCILSCTSLAIVYAVLVETGLGGTNLGKLLMASTFVTNLCMAVALSLIFAQWGVNTLIVALISISIIAFAPRHLPKVFLRYGDKVIEPEIKLLFFLLFVFMSLGKWGSLHAILPVFILGLCLSDMFRSHRDLHRKLRIGAFAMITPFFFIKAGMNVSLSALAANWPLVAILFGLKAATKFIGVFPLATRYVRENRAYLTLLLSTSLTFENIAAAAALQAGYITPTQFSILVSVVITAALVPAFIAQRWFSPRLPQRLKEEILAREEEGA